MLKVLTIKANKKAETKTVKPNIFNISDQSYGANDKNLKAIPSKK